MRAVSPQSGSALLRWSSILTSLVGVVAAGPGDADSVRDAIEAMNAFYNETTGLWDTGPWWHSGVALRAVAEYMLATGSDEYVDIATYTVDTQRAPLDWWPEGGGDFRADSTDDTGWWALALTSLYEVTGNSTYLDIARLDEAYMYDYWNTTQCGGGLIWAIPTRTYHNAISNELYLELTATLHNLIPGDTYYLNQALKEWEWFNGTGMINSAGLINDGLTEDDACVNNGQPIWTYNQGVILAGLVQLSLATEDSSYLDIAQTIADAVLASSTLSPSGILTENACATPADCEPNGTAFKGIFMRGLAKLDAALPDHPYRDYIRSNAQSAYDNARNSTDFYGFAWQGPFDDAGTIGKQESAVDLLLSAL
ncbi:putative glycosyl hydrolase [Xylaria bambusicola]|uniref:putative glycosyl hydrolase n=1 Tax=Xylaria bambusicola TaxID=326684 RepID=UPI0020075196|nr:putative glycosyl hydrolase [Xylaria bambusicola]KAI0509526.1 putative glycosyl hydrolase [Xylaria bambusicola]